MQLKGSRYSSMALNDSPTKWREGMRLEYRTEVFNLFNKPQFNNPIESGATAGAATVGIPTAGTLNYAGNPHSSSAHRERSSSR